MFLGGEEDMPNLIALKYKQIASGSDVSKCLWWELLSLSLLVQ